ELKKCRAHLAGFERRLSQRNVLADRKPDQRRLLDVQLGQQSIQIRAVIIFAYRQAGAAKSAQIIANNGVIARKGRDLRLPHAHVERKAVDQDKGRTFASDLISELSALNRNSSLARR